MQDSRPLKPLQAVIALLAAVSLVGCATQAPDETNPPGSSPEPSIDPAELKVLEVQLDPDRPLEPESYDVHLLVLDPQCGGSIDMPERVEIVGVDEGLEEVRIHLGAHPLPEGAYTCEGFPPTPFTVTLEEPLGDRAIIDDSQEPPRQLEPSR